MTASETQTFELDEWERSRISQMVSAEAFVYLGHYGVGAGLKREEVNVMNKLFRLGSKLRGEEPKEDLPYKGTRGNGWRKDLD